VQFRGMRNLGNSLRRFRTELMVAFCAVGLAATTLHAVAQQDQSPTPPSSLPVLGAPIAKTGSEPESVNYGVKSDSPQPVQSVGKHATPVEIIPLTPRTTTVGRKSSYSFKVNSSDWVDTGVTLNAGDHVEWSSSGTLKISDGREVTPEGVTRGWKDMIRQFPVNSANIGAVVARIGDTAAVPFLVGEKKDANLAQGGRLYLAANLSSDLTADGDFEVKIKLQPGAKVESSTAKASATKAKNAGTTLLPAPAGSPRTPAAAAEMKSELSPALFADIPRRVGDQQGNPGDMVNFSLIGTEDQVLNAFKTAGWTQVDRSTGQAVVHGLLATLEHQAYVEMPMSTLYLFGRPQDLSFARAAPIEVAAVRHHLRVWKTDKTVDGKPMWVGSATHDNGFEKDQRTGGVTHHIDANIDEERDFIEKSFAAAGVIEGAAYVLPDNPLRTAKTATGGSFNSDGRVVVMELK